jgi:MscS family membrane protein
MTTSALIEFATGSAGIFRVSSKPLRRLAGLWAALFVATHAWGQDPIHPLKPTDLSSPRATLKTFLDAGDAVGAYLVQDYLRSPSRTKFDHLFSLAGTVVKCLDLTEVAPAARRKTGLTSAAALYETLSRIQLPPFDQIPDAAQLSVPSGGNAQRWVIPDTELVIERVKSGPRSGEFLFSAATVARSEEFYQRVRGLAYTRPVPLEHFREIAIGGGGWMIPLAWIKALPPWLRVPIAGQSVWKWIVLFLILGCCALLLRLVSRLSRRGSDQRPLIQAVARLALPLFFLVATPAVTYFALVQINLIGEVASIIQLAATAIMFLAGAWIVWRIAPVIAEAIIATPKINTESVDAYLIRICMRLLGIVAAAGLLALGAQRLGLPVYGILAGLGVGGLAIALAAQPTIENLIGGLSLFADKPIRVGDFCRYGSDVGTIEAIGIRSTRIRGVDRTLTTIPNGELSKMAVVNFTRRDRMLIRSVIGVRYETSPEQLRYLLVRIREMLLGHPRIYPDPVRARFIGFGASSLNIEMFGYASTSDWAEFLGIREDLFLRVMDIVEQSGTGFAFPSQTLYFARDQGLDADRSEAAEAQVRQWRDEGRLPFPNASPEQMRQIAIDPPPGPQTGQPVDRTRDAL